MACGETDTVLRFVNALDVYSSAIKWSLERKGLINGSYIVRGAIGNNEYAAYASSVQELPHAAVRVLIALVVTSIAPIINPNSKEKEDLSDEGN